MDFLFPYPEKRNVQQEFMDRVYDTILNKKNLLIHAPTGIGKTVSALAPALTYALKNGKTVFFLTSRNTQHLIAIDTLREIREKFDKKFVVVDLIGKRHMCDQAGVNLLSSGEFFEYCKDLREKNHCNFYENLKLKGKTSPEALMVLDELKQMEPQHVEGMKTVCSNRNMCSYEVACLLGKEADIIIADYNYVLDKFVRENLLRRINKKMEDIIVIFDEAHNLPSRARHLMSTSVTSFVLDGAAKEIAVLGYEEMADDLKGIKNVVERFVRDKISIEKDEVLIKKDDFHSQVHNLGDYEEFIGNFKFVADQVLETKRRSFSLSVADFMHFWMGQDDGFVRVLNRGFSKKTGKPVFSLNYKCLDPQLIMADIKNAHAIIGMSGTLTPLNMYKDLLGLDAELLEFDNPFPKENRLNIILPETTSKYAARGEKMYKEIAERCVKIVKNVPGNIVIFFPSYFFRDKVNEFFSEACDKTVFLEDSGLTKEEKGDLLERFKGYKDQGAVLLGVAGGNFAEGIDLPGDYLKGVVVVGLPLGRPDLETQELINYYDKRFSRGWDYGYVFPAIIKTMQSAGRCIRSEKDRGIIVFLDERYVWRTYLQCFPKDWKIKIEKKPYGLIKLFFM
ncbi:ATP-dependent DNA helicase [archaeon]|jgi:DNA excision repair protein ERCC-2|nr:ATP-dependent DNA helicase [archaeon]MBT4397498.1 ATP-dependent DNA helicase [archaeon]MBT4440893.1 ATP-dependent DNA helicase [archaeon]